MPYRTKSRRTPRKWEEDHVAVIWTPDWPTQALPRILNGAMLPDRYWVRQEEYIDKVIPILCLMEPVYGNGAYNVYHFSFPEWEAIMEKLCPSP